MSFKEGNKHGKGRPRGVMNKLQASDKEALHDIFVNDLIPTFRQDIKKLSAGQRIQVTLKLMEFYIPKLRATYIETDIDSINDQTAGHIIAEILRNTFKDGQPIPYSTAKRRNPESEDDH